MHDRPPLTGPPPAALRPLVALGTATAALLAGCTSAVEVRPFEGSDSPACQRVADAWPATVRDLERREVAVQSRGVAAWGDPAIIARCGADPPGPTTDQCLDVAGVDWIARELEDGWRFTSYGRDPAVEVLVPDAHDPDALLLTAFNPAAEAVPQGERRCT